MTTSPDSDRPAEALPPPGFVLPDTARSRKGRHPKDLLDYFDRIPPVTADDEFWTSRPYQPNAREAQLLTLALGLFSLLILGTTVWFPFFLTCAGVFGVGSIMAGLIIAVGHYQNPWWRLPPLLAIACGLIDLAGIASWLSTR